MEEKKRDDSGSDGVDEFFGDDVEQEGAPSNTMAERWVLQTIEHLKSEITLWVPPIPPFHVCEDSVCNDDGVIKVSESRV